MRDELRANRKRLERVAIEDAAKCFRNAIELKETWWLDAGMRAIRAYASDDVRERAGHIVFALCALKACQP